MAKITLLTYPRSGQHFLKYALTEATNIEVIAKHPNVVLLEENVEFAEGTNTVSIARNPKDSIASIVTLELSAAGLTYVDSTYLDARISYYQKAYEYILSYVNTFIDYNDLSDMQSLVNKICQKFGGSITGNLDGIHERYEANHLETEPEWKLISSKNQDVYSNIMTVLDSRNLARCEELYNQALERTI